MCIFSRYSRFIEDVRAASFLLLERQQNIFYWIDAIYKRTKSGKALKEAIQRLFAEVDRVRLSNKLIKHSVASNFVKFQFDYVINLLSFVVRF